jgi:hypothetical protein
MSAERSFAYGKSNRAVSECRVCNHSADPTRTGDHFPVAYSSSDPGGDRHRHRVRSSSAAGDGHSRPIFRGITYAGGDGGCGADSGAGRAR